MFAERGGALEDVLDPFQINPKNTSSSCCLIISILLLLIIISPSAIIIIHQEKLFIFAILLARQQVQAHKLINGDMLHNPNYQFDEDFILESGF
jgi:hypothetical protein